MEESAIADQEAAIATCYSVSEGSYVSKFWRAHTDKEWTEKNGNNNNNSDDKIEDDVCGVSLKENLRLVLSPSSDQRGRRFRNQRNKQRQKHKNDAVKIAINRFHKDLKSDDVDGMVVMFRAKADQFISVTLSPWPALEKPPVETETAAAAATADTDADKELKEEESAVTPEAPPSPVAKRYEVVFGSNNNTTTTIRKVFIRSKTNRSNNTNTTRNEKSSSVRIPSRVCRGFGGENEKASADDNNNNNNNNNNDDDDNDDNDASWTSYWVCLSNSRLYVGMGNVPGKECFGLFEEEETEMVQQEHKESQEEVPVKAEAGTEDDQARGSTEALPIRYVGIGNDAAVQKNRDSVVKVKDLVVTNVPPSLEGILRDIPSQDQLPVVCLAPASAFSSSGMDVDEDAETLELRKYMEEYKAECLVRKRRAKKYGTDYREQPMKDFLPWTMAKRLKGKHNIGMDLSATNSQKAGFVAGDIDFLDPEEISKREARFARFAAKSNTNTNGDGAGADAKPSKILPRREGLPWVQAWDKEAMLRSVRRDPPAYLWTESPSNADTLAITTAPDPFSMYDETTKAATWINDKLHFSAIDWAAFKQIRNDDLIHHLEAYGPIKYIEWLGDVSCNVCFGNKASASRALVCLSNELPSPTPAAKPAPVVVAPTSEVMTEGGVESPTEPTAAAASTPAPAATPNIDLGCMTWRFGKRPIEKISNDRHGRKGTTARYLLRFATTEDVLIDRPNYWPEPPGGFNADSVLGPMSDYASTKKQKKKKKPQQQQATKKSQQQQQSQQQNRRGKNSKRKRGKGNLNGNGNDGKSGSKNNDKTIGNPIDLLNRGLSSSRGGFSVEEMERERQAKKRQKTS